MRLFHLLLFLTAAVFCTPLAQAEKFRILYLGDSLSMGAFGQTFDSSVRSDGFELYTVVAGGASPYYWLKSYQELPSTIGFWEKTPTTEKKINYIRSVPKLENMIEDYKPQFVVVQTGINLYATLRSRRKPKDENVVEVRSLIDQMCHSIAKSGARSYWILPPHSHERRYSKELQTELADIMRSVIREYGGAIFESSRVTRYTAAYPANDGIHYGSPEAAAWASKVHADFLLIVRSAQRNQLTQSRNFSQSPSITQPQPDARSHLLISTRPVMAKAAPKAPAVPLSPLPGLEGHGWKQSHRPARTRFETRRQIGSGKYLGNRLPQCSRGLRIRSGQRPPRKLSSQENPGGSRSGFPPETDIGSQAKNRCVHRPEAGPSRFLQNAANLATNRSFAAEFRYADLHTAAQLKLRDPKTAPHHRGMCQRLKLPDPGIASDLQNPFAFDF